MKVPVSVSMENELVAKIDIASAILGLKRSEFVAKVMEEVAIGVSDQKMKVSIDLKKIKKEKVKDVA